MSCSERSFQPDDQSPPKGMADRVQARSEDSGRRVNELMYSNADLRTTINVVPELAWCNRPDGSVEFTNSRWYDYTGLPLQNAHGSGWQETVHPEDMLGLIEKWNTLRSRC